MPDQIRSAYKADRFVHLYIPFTLQELVLGADHYETKLTWMMSHFTWMELDDRI